MAQFTENKCFIKVAVLTWWVFVFLKKFTNLNSSKFVVLGSELWFGSILDYEALLLWLAPTWSRIEIVVKLFSYKNTRTMTTHIRELAVSAYRGDFNIITLTKTWGEWTNTGWKLQTRSQEIRENGKGRSMSLHKGMFKSAQMGVCRRNKDGRKRVRKSGLLWLKSRDEAKPKHCIQTPPNHA